MKAIFKLIYDTENFDDVKLIQDMQRVVDYKLALFDIDNHLREQIKYNTELSDEQSATYQKIRTMLYDILKEYNLSLE
jgi:hypothetical protein